MKTAALARPAWATALLAAVAACAHVEPPPGGPEDQLPPVLLRTTPDSLAVVPGLDEPVRFVFDERISEQGVQEAVVVSPRTSPVRVDHGGRGVAVSLRQGWEPGVVYHVTLQPGLRDLFGNRIEQAATVVFSTGPEIPDTRLAADVVDRVTGEPATDVRVDAVRLADSLVYVAPADSAGAYVLARIPPGQYRVRAFEDLDLDREPDDFERQDTATTLVGPGDTARVELSVVMPDTTPPEIRSVTVEEDRLIVEFDDYLLPDQPLPPGRVRLQSVDGRGVGVERLAVGQLPPEREPAAEEAAPEPAPEAAPDTAAAPLPSQRIVVQLDSIGALEPGAEYEIRFTRVTNIVGLTSSPEATFTAPEAPEPPEGEGPTGEPERGAPEDELPAGGKPPGGPVAFIDRSFFHAQHWNDHG